MNADRLRHLDRRPRSSDATRMATASALVAAALTLAGCNSPTIPPGNYGTITGTVTSTSGQPVADVTVQADFGPRGVSGPDGRYTIVTVPISSSLSPAHVEVTLVPTGYRKPPARDDVQVQAGQTTPNVNFVLPPG